jgi:hypothetical protein
VEEAWQSPVSSLLNTIKDTTTDMIHLGVTTNTTTIDQNNSPRPVEALKQIFGKLVKTVTSDDIYGPNLDEIDVDDVTKSWMEDVFWDNKFPRYAPKITLTSTESPSLETTLLLEKGKTPSRNNSAAKLDIPAAIADSSTRIFTRSPSMPSFLADLSNHLSLESRQIELRLIQSWDLAPWELSTEQTISCLITMFEDLDLLEPFSISTNVMASFLFTCQQNYQDNPYHNFHHAFDVTQTTYLIAKRSHARNILSKLELLALLIASICHDCKFSKKKSCSNHIFISFLL